MFELSFEETIILSIVIVAVVHYLTKAITSRMLQKQQQDLRRGAAVASHTSTATPDDATKKEKEEHKVKQEEVTKEEPATTTSSPLPQIVPEMSKEEEDLLDSVFEEASLGDDVLDVAIDNVHSVIVHRQNAANFLEKRLFTNALREVESALKTCPHESALIDMKCEALFGLKEYREVMVVAKRLIQMNKTSPIGWKWLVRTTETWKHEMGTALGLWREASALNVEPFKLEFEIKCKDVSKKIGSVVNSGVTSPVLQQPETQLMMNPRYLVSEISKESVQKHLNRVWLMVAARELSVYLD
eukprot:PhM_4_TR11816/c0_g1_i1/m.40183